MSREIDAMVHVEVMGGRFVQRYSTMGTREVEVCHAGAYPIVIQDGKDVPHSAWDGAWHIGQLPAYSTDPAAAMQVVERMRELGYLVTMSDLSPHRSGRGNRRGQWFVRFTKKGEEGKQSGVATGDNVCEVGCLAALRAVGVDAGEGKP